MQIPLTIGICGSRSRAGKTSFIENFLKYIKKQLNKKINVIAVKYTKTSFYSSIIVEPLPEDEGKDTARMKKAGADHVLWVKAKEEDLPDIVEKLNEQIFCLNGDITVIEGNSLVRVMQPDVIIFLKSGEKEYIKPSGKAILEIADIVIEEDYSIEEIMKEIEKIQQKKLIHQLLKERSNDGKITCAEARKIAEELNVPYIDVGRAANELRIKIRKCELGCF